jgi:hypothetical protein
MFEVGAGAISCAAPISLCVGGGVLFLDLEETRACPEETDGTGFLYQGCLQQRPRITLKNPYNIPSGARLRSFSRPILGRITGVLPR